MISQTEREIFRERVLKLLPGVHCGICSYARHNEFAEALLEKKTEPGECKFLFHYFSI